MAKYKKQDEAARSNLPERSHRQDDPTPSKEWRSGDSREPTSPHFVPSEGNFAKYFGPPKKIPRSPF